MSLEILFFGLLLFLLLGPKGFLKIMVMVGAFWKRFSLLEKKYHDFLEKYQHIDVHTLEDLLSASQKKKEASPKAKTKVNKKLPQEKKEKKTSTKKVLTKKSPKKKE